MISLVIFYSVRGRRGRTSWRKWREAADGQIVVTNELYRSVSPEPKKTTDKVTGGRHISFYLAERVFFVCGFGQEKKKNQLKTTDDRSKEEIEINPMTSRTLPLGRVLVLCRIRLNVISASTHSMMFNDRQTIDCLNGWKRERMIHSGFYSILPHSRFSPKGPEWWALCDRPGVSLSPS